mmetsp:Transcript_21477/g.55076  ORF Transcript_21477/g.55076 Transcript_21477/m.55076 type:complete len:352 (-) Transcript_21477:53-1108(-)
MRATRPRGGPRHAAVELLGSLEVLPRHHPPAGAGPDPRHGVHRRPDGHDPPGEGRHRPVPRPVLRAAARSHRGGGLPTARVGGRDAAAPPPVRGVHHRAGQRPAPAQRRARRRGAGARGDRAVLRLLPALPAGGAPRGGDGQPARAAGDRQHPRHLPAGGARAQGHQLCAGRGPLHVVQPLDVLLEHGRRAAAERHPDGLHPMPGAHRAGRAAAGGDGRAERAQRRAVDGLRLGRRGRRLAALLARQLGPRHAPAGARGALGRPARTGAGAGAAALRQRGVGGGAPGRRRGRRERRGRQRGRGGVGDSGHGGVGQAADSHRPHGHRAGQAAAGSGGGGGGRETRESSSGDG